MVFPFISVRVRYKVLKGIDCNAEHLAPEMVDAVRPVGF